MSSVQSRFWPFVNAQAGNAKPSSFRRSVKSLCCAETIYQKTISGLQRSGNAVYQYLTDTTFLIRQIYCFSSMIASFNSWGRKLMIRIPLFQVFTLHSHLYRKWSHRSDKYFWPLGNIFGPWETLALQPQATVLKSIKIILIAFSQKKLRPLIEISKKKKRENEERKLQCNFGARKCRRRRGPLSCFALAVFFTWPNLASSLYQLLLSWIVGTQAIVRSTKTEL